MFERFTDRARRVVVLSQEEARRLSHSYIGTEHMLLGILAEGDNWPAQVISPHLDLANARSKVEEVVGMGKIAPRGHIPFTPRMKRVLEFALREALQLGHNYIGPEHVMLGLLREGEGIACTILATRIPLDTVKQELLDLVGHNPEADPSWPEEFRRTAARLTKAMAEASRQLEHLVKLLEEKPE